MKKIGFIRKSKRKKKVRMTFKSSSINGQRGIDINTSSIPNNTGRGEEVEKPMEFFLIAGTVTQQNPNQSHFDTTSTQIQSDIKTALGRCSIRQVACNL